MTTELKMQEELKKVIAKEIDAISEELSDEELETVAGGKLKCCYFKTRPWRRPGIRPCCILRSRRFNANELE
jgi:hypothetical protein